MPSRNRNRCPHGYERGSCSQCRAARAPADVIARQDQIRARLDEIEQDPYATEESHGAERDELIREYVVLRSQGAGAITGAGGRP